ncbi:MAG: hypothetical protein R2838_19545 [Caldilineaceae bacterium]
MPNCQYANFDITILGTDAPYPISAQFDGQSAEGAFTEQVDDPFWQEIVARFGAVHHPPGSAQIRAAGTRLFDSLIAGDVQRLWIRAETRIGNGGLRVRLAIQPPRVAALPWEALFDRDRNRLLAASGRTPLVRMETPVPLPAGAPSAQQPRAAEHSGRRGRGSLRRGSALRPSSARWRTSSPACPTTKCVCTSAAAVSAWSIWRRESPPMASICTSSSATVKPTACCSGTTVSGGGGGGMRCPPHCGTD